MNPFKIGAIVFFAGFLISAFMAAALFFSQVKFIKNSFIANGKVVEIAEDKTDKDISYSPIIEYIDQKGKLHKGQSPIWSNKPSYKVGDSLEIRYNPNEENKIYVNNFFGLWSFPLVALILSLGMLFFAGGFFYNTYYKEILGRQLIKSGNKIQAVIKEIEHEAADVVGSGKRYNIFYNVPFIVIAGWKDENNKEYIFRSKYLTNDPQLKLKPGDKVDIYVDPKNYRRYFMDLDGLK